MPFFAIFFLLGDLYLQTNTQLPAKIMMLLLFIISMIFLFFPAKHKKIFIFFSAMLLGYVWSAWYASTLLTWTFPKELEGHPLLITGYISSLPATENNAIHFLFAMQQYKSANTIYPCNVLISLSYRISAESPPPVFRVGDQYQLIVRMKRIHGVQNLGGSDFEAWALQKRLRGVGNVVANTENIFLSHAWYYHPIDQFRQKLQQKIKQHLPHTATAPWLLALILGERSEVNASDWQVLRNTGTNHLMAIAGLHIGLLAALMHVIVTKIWRLFPYLLLRFPAAHAGACAALISAFFYSLLAGFSLPTQRACLMLTVFICTLLAKQKISSWSAWSFALLLVLVFNPLCVLSESFWLSFVTLALIIYGMSGRLAPQGYWWKWGRVQWVIGIGLIPLTLVFFQQFSLVSFLVNSIAIPWLGFFILPFCFLALIFLYFFPSISTLCLYLADKSLASLWVMLNWFSQLHFAVWQQAMPNYYLLFFFIIGIVILLIPAGFPGRWIGVIWLLPTLFYQPNRPALGDFWLTLLDVGQGLSAIVQTKNHVLVYDAGPKFNAHIDLGENVVVPYLLHIQQKHIDKLVVSHADNDHIGGTNSLLTALSVRSIATSVPEKFVSYKQYKQKQVSYCFTGETWRWDEVKFTFLYPSQENLQYGNDSSCVLRIDNGQQSILLTGDIEKYAEMNLLNNNPQALAATLMIAPHHGSKTSGLEKFIAQVNPKFVLYATGYQNRYHFPHPSVTHTYAKLKIQQFNTAQTGMMFFKFTKTKLNPEIELYRITQKHYWFD